jgi:hypothetical protein
LDQEVPQESDIAEMLWAIQAAYTPSYPHGHVQSLLGLSPTVSLQKQVVMGPMQLHADSASGGLVTLGKKKITYALSPHRPLQMVQRLIMHAAANGPRANWPIELYLDGLSTGRTFVYRPSPDSRGWGAHRKQRSFVLEENTRLFATEGGVPGFDAMLDTADPK